MMTNESNAKPIRTYAENLARVNALIDKKKTSNAPKEGLQNPSFRAG